MAMPDFQKIMLPALQCIGSRDVVSTRDVVLAVEQVFSLSSEEKQELLNSGQRRIVNRTAWAIIYMTKAGLLRRVERGKYSISDAGRSVLAAPPANINDAFLMQYGSFRDFKALSQKEGGETEDTTRSGNGAATNPQEAIEQNYKLLRVSIIDDLLRLVRGMDPTEFELLVVELLRAMGYSVVHKGGSADGGIDGEISQDKLGLDIICIQVKRYAEDSPVGRPALQQFYGSIKERKASKGIFLTTSYFTDEAREYIEKVDAKIELVDGKRLADYMYEHNVGITRQHIYEVKKIDHDYFED